MLDQILGYSTIFSDKPLCLFRFRVSANEDAVWISEVYRIPQQLRTSFTSKSMKVSVLKPIWVDDPDDIFGTDGLCSASILIC